MLCEFAQAHFAWDSMFSRLRATAMDRNGAPLVELFVELPSHVLEAMRAARGAGIRARLEQMTEQQLRALVSLQR